MMKLKSALKLFAASMLCVLSAAAVAEDIDLYSTTNSSSKPNVLIVIDNSSNWGNNFLGSSAPLPNCPAPDRTKFCSEIAALATVINTLNSNIRVGLMMFAQTAGQGGHGAYVRFAVRDMTPDNKAALINLIKGLYMSDNAANKDDSSSSQPYGKAMFEAFKYFGGYTDPAHALLNEPGTSSNPPANSFGPTAYMGTNATGAYRRDYFDNAVSANRSARFYGADGNTAFSSVSSNEYISPITDACAKNFILFISNGNPSTGGDSGGGGSEQPAPTLLSNINPTTTQLGSPETHASKGDEFAKYLNLTDVSPLTGQQNVITYTMGVYAADGPKGTCQWGDNIRGSDCDMITLMKSMAVNGGGTYYNASDAQSLALGFQSFFADVQAVNSVFVSSSLPVSVNTQGTYLNQVYMGMFRPDADAKPRWVGNMKQYQFIYSSASGQLVLADNSSPTPLDAINPGNGFIKPTATSFWSTPQTTYGSIAPFDFWVNSPAGTGLSLAQQKQDAPDGDIVEKGGVAQRIRAANLTTTAQALRNVYSCASTGCTANAPLSTFAFNSTNIAGSTYQTAFGLTGSTAATDLSNIVNWVRGNDNAANEAKQGPGTVGTTAITVRASIHGDVLHSRPVLVNYAATGATTDNVIGFYGSNDGTLRAVQAGQGSSGGTELWSFVAPEFFGKLKRLRDTTPLLQLPSPSSGLVPAVAVDSSGNSRPKDYFFDGAVTVHEVRSSGVVTGVYLFVVARRGGNFIYALNVTNPNNPIFLWKKSTQSGSNFSDMALTFSAPLVGKVKGNTNPVLIFGGGYYGGYDATTKAPIGEDAEPAASCSGAKAIVDGSTPAGLTIGCGNRIFVLDAFTGNPVHSFPSGSDPAITKSVPSDVSLVDSDGDGNIDRVYAVDVGGNVWRMDIDNANPSAWKLYKLASVTSPRKFMYPPEFVLTSRFAAVLVGSGDREKPLKVTGLDRFYMFKDKKTGKDATGMVPIVGDLTTAYNMADAANLTLTDLTTTLANAANNGWFYTFVAGEKVVNAPVVVGPVVYFSTSTPDLAIAGTCAANLGVARAYGMLFTNGTSGRGEFDQNGNWVPWNVFVTLEGGGLPPSPVAGMVNVLDSATGNTVPVPFIIGSGGTTAPPPAPPCTGSGCPPANPCPGPKCLVCPANTVPSSIGGSMVCLQPDSRRRKSYWFFKSDQ